MLHLIQDTRYQHDGGLPRQGRQETQWSHTYFSNKYRLVAEAVAISWPPKSSDLNPCDYHLLDHFKQLVYIVINDHNQLLQGIRDAETDIRNNCKFYRMIGTIVI